MFKEANDEGIHYIATDKVDIETERLCVRLEDGRTFYFKLVDVQPNPHMTIDAPISDVHGWKVAYDRYLMRHQPTDTFKVHFPVWDPTKRDAWRVAYQPEIGRSLSVLLGHGVGYTMEGGHVVSISSVSITL